MSLLFSSEHGYEGAQLWTAALSIANNRRSKVELLRADGDERCDRIADRFQASLEDDVEAFIAEHPERPLVFARELRRAATWSDEDYAESVKEQYDSEPYNR